MLINQASPYTLKQLDAIIAQLQAIRASLVPAVSPDTVLPVGVISSSSAGSVILPSMGVTSVGKLLPVAPTLPNTPKPEV
jgi:hypothetical protein